MKNKTKIAFAAVAVMLSVVLVFVCCIGSTYKDEEITLSLREIVLTTETDAERILNGYEDSSFTVSETTGTFVGYQSLDVSVLSETDNISDSEKKTLDNCRVKYIYTYSAETNIVTISAEMNNEYGEIFIDELSGMAFINENGEVDAVLSLDGEENILLSDLIEAGAIENVGWLSRLFRTVVVAVVAAAAVAITVVTAGAGAGAAIAMTAAAVVATQAYDIYEQTQAYKNYQHNWTLESSVSGLVNGQGFYSQWRFGASSFDNNGCGVIATYNVMYLLGKDPKLSEVTYDIERKQGTLVFGYAGTDPTHPIEYFKSKGIAVKQYYDYNGFDSALTNMRDDQYAIVCYWNDKNNIKRGAHFVAVSKNSSGGFDVYNYSKNNSNYDTRTNLSDIMNKHDGKLITGLIIN